MALYIAELPSAAMRARIYDALAVYIEAMGYPRSVAAARAPMWAEHVLRPGWRAVGAFRDAGAIPPTGPATPTEPVHPPGASADPGADDLVGIAYGYHGSDSQWWSQQVRRGIALQHRDPAYADRVLRSYFELTELHVHPSAQGGGLGEALARRLLDGCGRDAALLSTPEVALGENRAWRLYRRLGFQDVLRHFRFQGDNRPFAVLGRALPLGDTP